jgi:hypothetical protein
MSPPLGVLPLRQHLPYAPALMLDLSAAAVRASGSGPTADVSGTGAIDPKHPDSLPDDGRRGDGKRTVAYLALRRRSDLRVWHLRAVVINPDWSLV